MAASRDGAKPPNFSPNDLPNGRLSPALKEISIALARTRHLLAVVHVHDITAPLQGGRGCLPSSCSTAPI